MEDDLITGSTEEADMDTAQEFQDMLEVLITAIAIHEKEEEFFRRSAVASSSRVAKDLFLEIADDLRKYREALEARKQKLVDASEALSESNHQGKGQAGREEVAESRDPVCGMRVDPANSSYFTTYENRKYYFCSPSCRDAFNLAPEKYKADEPN
jgi:YHS domain-containing protein